MRTPRFLVLTVAGGIVATTMSFLAAPAFATDYTASGSLRFNAPNGVSVTNRHFAHTGCVTPNATQGLDAYVFAVPSAYAVDGATFTLSASSDTVHDFGAYIYNSDCSLDRKVVTAETFDLTSRLGPDDTYIVVYSATGSDIALSLTVTPPTTTTYYDEGAIASSAPTGVSATDTEFGATCQYPPASQGTDGFVFRIPASAAAAGSLVTIANVPTNALHNFVAAFYDSSCGFLRLIDDTSSTEVSFTAGSTDAYVSVWSTSGSNLLPELTI